MQYPTPEPPATGSGPLYFSVSPLKLIVMSVVTFGLYELYWFWENWKAVQRRTGQAMMPFWRAFFGVFWCHALFKEIQESAGAHGVTPRFAAGWAAAVWIVLTITWRLPGAFWLVSFLAVLALVPVQNTINELNARVAPGHETNQRFSALNITGVILGGLFLLASIAGSFLPEP